MNKSILIYYFSGTGNAKHLAERCAANLIHKGCTAGVFDLTRGPHSNHAKFEMHGFIFPVYAWGLPRLVDNFLKNLPQAEEKEAFIFASPSDKAGLRIILNQAQKRLRGKGYAKISGDGFAMPHNFVILLNCPSPEEARQTIARAEADIDQTMEKLFRGYLPIESPAWWERLLFVPLYQLFRLGTWAGINRFLFRADKKCDACEICAQICPTNNIIMEKGKPKWGANCETCLRCINLCPKESIQFLFSKKKRRYKEPHLNLADFVLR